MILSVTLVIILSTVLISILALNNHDMFRKLAYSPYAVIHNKEYYRLLTHAFLHAGWLHLFVNMYVLYYFGKATEIFYNFSMDRGGTFYFILLYLGGVFFATLPALQKQKTNPLYSSVGASGAVSSVLFAFIVLRPTEAIYFIFIPIPIPAFIFGILYLFYEAYMDKNSQDYVAHDAHYYGAIFGILFTFVFIKGAFIGFFNQIFSYFT